MAVLFFKSWRNKGVNYVKITIEPEAVSYIEDEGGFATIRYIQQG